MDEKAKDINWGRQLFESVPNNLKPSWAGVILSHFDFYIKTIPTPVKELHSIISDPSKWNQAHQQFTLIRKFLLGNPKFKPENYLLLSELVAKITYNASGCPAPFDHDSGWYIPGLAIMVARDFKDEELEQQLITVIHDFGRPAD